MAAGHIPGRVKKQMNMHRQYNTILEAVTNKFGKDNVKYDAGSCI